MIERLRLDHIVYAVPDLAAGIATFEESLGVAPTFGGRHTGMGTHNAILPFRGETYLELIASDPDAPDPSGPRPFGLDHLEGTRLVTWAVRSRGIDADVVLSKANGYDPGFVIPVSREEPGGTVLSWKLTLRAEPRGDGLVPFVIDWGDARHPTRAAGAEAQCDLTGFSAQHPDPDSIRADLDALGCALEIADAPTPGFRAEITGPAGSLTLT